jgi:hypothetical protein
MRRWLGFSLVLLSSSVWSFQPLITDDTGTQGTGAIQVEVSYGHQRDAMEGVSGETNTRSLPLVFTRGVTDALDLKPEVLFAVSEDEEARGLGARTNPDRLRDPWMGFVELGLVVCPSDDLDLALGVIHNTNNGYARTTQALLGLTWCFQ